MTIQIVSIQRDVLTRVGFASRIKRWNDWTKSRMQGDASLLATQAQNSAEAQAEANQGAGQIQGTRRQPSQIVPPQVH
jgi:hypothetical protein